MIMIRISRYALPAHGLLMCDIYLQNLNVSKLNILHFVSFTNDDIIYVDDSFEFRFNIPKKVATSSNIEMRHETN